MFGMKHRHVIAHRAAWELLIGPIPSGMCLLHSCDNPRCVNPEHLRVGTQLENIDDRNQRGRTQRRPGATNHQAKLTEEQARQILDLKGSGLSQREVGLRYGVTRTNIGYIWRGEHWAHLQRTVP